MDCARFEQELARLMGEDSPAVDGGERLRGLRDHATSCPACAGCIDLLNVLELPAGQRDIVASPDADYWADFDERLRRRLDEPESRTRASAGWVWGGLAAAMLLVGIGLWWLPGQVPTPDAPPVDVAVQPAAPAEPQPVPEAGVDSAESMQAQIDDLPTLGGWGVDPANDLGEVGGRGGWSGDLFPDVDDLDSEARQELLEWLREQSS